MAAPNFQGKTSFVRQFIAGVKAAANAVVDSSVGSFTLAVGQAVTAAALWLQAQIINVLLLTRAATSTGSDLDSFYADFNFSRLPAKKATTTETFSRATPTLQAVVLVGQLIQTGPAGIQYAVTVDSANAAYNATLDGYVLPPGTASVTVPIMAVVAGAATGNVLANTITSFVSPIPGVDSCTNPADVTNGEDAESDPAFRARFPVYLASLATANSDAIDNAIQNVQQGIQWIKVENKDYPGTVTDNGNFFVVVDDGSGEPPDSLITAVANAINPVRGFTIRYTVNKVTIEAVTAALAIRIASGFTTLTVQNAVAAAVANAVNAIELGSLSLFISAIETAALTVSGCIAVKPANTTINGVQADLALTVIQRPRIGNSDVTVSTY